MTTEGHSLVGTQESRVHSLNPGKGNGNPLQYSCPENSMERGAWQALSPGGCKELDTTEDYHSFAQTV